MDRVDPVDLFEAFGGIDVQVDDHRFVITSHQDALQRRIAQGVDFLVRNIGRYENKIAGIRLRRKFEALAPTHPRCAPHDINDAFQRAVVVSAGLRIRLNDHRAGPQLLRADPGKIHRGRAQHARGLRRIAVQSVTLDDPHALVAPIVF